MNAKAKKKKRPNRRPGPALLPYRTLQGWAIGVLLECHAIVECPDHGHIRDRGSWPLAWDEAREVAKRQPFLGASKKQCLTALDEVMASVGDVCPEC